MVRKSETRVIYVPVATPSGGKSKLLMLFLENFAGGALGLDRLYMGCYKQAAAKFGLLAGGALLLLFNSGVPALVYAGFAALIAWALWYVFDYWAVTLNALTSSEHAPSTFCDGHWAPGEVHTGFVVALVLALLQVTSWALFFMASPASAVATT
jgi:hypothetical protein